MRNVRSALVAAVVGLSLTTACSFSSSRSWGSGASPNSSQGKGKPALHNSDGRPAQKTSNGKPAQKTPTPVATPKPAPTPAPAPAPAPAVEPPVEDKPPTRVPRDETPTSGATGKAGTTIGAKPTQPPQPVQPINGGAAKKPAPRGLSISPAQPEPPARGLKSAPNN